MNTLSFSTNLKCSGCVAKVTPFLNQVAGEGNWKAELDQPDKVVTVTKEGVTAAAVVKAIQQAGYVATPLP